MIELQNDRLVFSFPEVHADARFSVEFQRTLRIPDDERDYPLPPGLGRFPVRHVDDAAKRTPEAWRTRGGVMLPMYQSEALWLNFDSPTGYPIALKIAAGKINAVNGDPWSNVLRADRQDYVVLPGQPWLDGYYVEDGCVRQFVAMPLGSGYSAEEQLTGRAEHGGLQLLAFPLKAEVWERMKEGMEKRWSSFASVACMEEATMGCYDMGLAPGGRMTQDIYDDPNDFADWNTGAHARCFVHIANSLVWRQVTGEQPPTVPPTSTEYAQAGFPWFDYYDESQSQLPAGDGLGGLESITQLGAKKGDNPLPENGSVEVSDEVIVKLGTGRRPRVRVGEW
jgi:hypothetical protein